MNRDQKNRVNNFFPSGKRRAGGALKPPLEKPFETFNYKSLRIKNVSPFWEELLFTLWKSVYISGKATEQEMIYSFCFK